MTKAPFQAPASARPSIISPPFAKADALEKRAIARYASGKIAEAIDSWRGGSTLCKTFDYHERRRSTLERLIAAYKAIGRSAERRACENELKAVEA